ncbi:ChaN family lipoprotein [Geomesophilobacter sediminis]|uniref:ChaN family lipoprotein n=1 Tax=Geomesophilobacter sediminis TaxID=2798584 RepID=A0A8J7M289_9BACT|nr:ChaN family lipoprotein [Geomesophilobacter sediminis]MBJ6727380.1 ChaN family lipoprotein [Geomesophilobacter sediminis]
MKTLAAMTLGIFLTLATSIGAGAATTLVRMSDHQPVELGKCVEELGRSDVIFVGDTHDDPDLHNKQMELIRALYAKNPQLAIGVEMFTSESQAALDGWTRGKLDEPAFEAIYARNWSYDWRLYRDIFIFARDNRIPMIALNVPKRLIAKVVRFGPQGLSEEERKELPPGDPWTLAPRQAEFLKRLQEQVFGNRPARLNRANFEAAQGLRNHTFAYRIEQYLEKTPKAKVIAIAGTWHAIKHGAPDSLKDYGKLSYKVVLPDLVDFEWQKPTPEDLDYLMPRRK